ncbi:CDP-glycerol glycerophosphotransferase family protein [Buttiauxella selenatireducens]|uniref:CDP-glycerol glycerophosphotransferase family protein n=1 Tax=Buttiauxella selenatireducens TaxID=3073902 RepID=A0ABY9SBN6_9ENTR|nr:CDP-glycerol glycerophosphotransferase family protein [Buttiauxella sp. R73]WMY74576.1 CDP-glycerol glycerophosphotransferase family protein [Buttiauxella sp. R73]
MTVVRFLLYLISFGLPKKNVVIFNSYKNTKFSFIAKNIFLHGIMNGKVNYKFVINDEKLRNCLIDTYGDYFITSTNIKDCYTICTAKFWVTSTSPVYKFPFCNIFRKVINVWHGIPLKNIGVLDYEVSAYKSFLYKTVYRTFYTYFMVPSPSLGEVYKNSFCIGDDKVVYSGLIQPHIVTKENIKDKLGAISKDVKVILYATTWRSYDTDYFPFADFNLEKLNNYLVERDYIILIKPHHLEKSSVERFRCSNIIIVDDSYINDISHIFNSVDLLVTDYSSIYFDYLMTSDPYIIFVPYDLDKYKYERGFNMDYEYVTPGPKVKTLNDFCNEIDCFFSGRSLYKEKVEYIRVNYCGSEYNMIDKFNELIS